MNTKQLQLVTFEQAKRLKALGFDWELNTGWSGTMKKSADHYVKVKPFLFFENITDNWNCKKRFEKLQYHSAPTVALALKWFRDEKCFDYSIIKGRLPFEYSYSLLNGKQGKLHIRGYEAAESALLDELLTILEKEG